MPLTVVYICQNITKSVLKSAQISTVCWNDTNFQSGDYRPVFCRSTPQCIYSRQRWIRMDEIESNLTTSLKFLFILKEYDWLTTRFDLFPGNRPGCFERLTSKEEIISLKFENTTGHQIWTGDCRMFTKLRWTCSLQLHESWTRVHCLFCQL